MGTDIHAAIEYRDANGWHAYLTANKWHGRPGFDEEPLLSASLDLDRDYDLFAILGSVRNGTGFAGCKLSDGVEPISDSRGVPDDATPETLAALSNEHSATWVTFPEILAYDWNRSTNKYGVVTAKEFEKWDRMKEWRPGPESFAGDVMGPKVRKVTETEMRSYVQTRIGSKRGTEFETAVAEMDREIYAQITWVETYAEMGKQLWVKVLPIMLKLATEHGHENVRMVMDFDS